MGAGVKEVADGGEAFGEALCGEDKWSESTGSFDRGLGANGGGNGSAAIRGPGPETRREGFGESRNADRERGRLVAGAGEEVGEWLGNCEAGGMV